MNKAVILPITVEQLPVDYIQKYPKAIIDSDCLLMNMLIQQSQQYAIAISDNSSPTDRIWQVKLLRLNDNVSLSRSVPIIENFGLKLLAEQTFIIRLTIDTMISICDFSVEVPLHLVTKIHDTSRMEFLKHAITAAFMREIESDPLNKLVLTANLSHREIALLRAMVRYSLQTKLAFSQTYIYTVLIQYVDITAMIIQLFSLKFCKKYSNIQQATAQLECITQALNGINNIAEDQILKAILSIVVAMVRCNFFQYDSANKPYSYISLKLESAKVLNLPHPHPLYEIFVYSLQFEAIHLRCGLVARGGIRWSDRHEDFRTEILGLVKTQTVKNAVIVPTGAKGGFFCKKINNNSEETAKIGLSCYKQFIQALLLLTDNIVAGKIIKPRDVICHDLDDPYLVVAADKGTAKFSDAANVIALDHNFWLGDAFASGGSAGYDHKQLAITARGVWESLNSHLRYNNLTTTRTYTVIGIGDLMGDVFGNGMVLSDRIQLLAAFNHQHIFLDPTPDAAVSYSERLRIFQLPVSTWENYNRTLLSTGGDILLRSAKSLVISAEAQAMLGLSINRLTPNELIVAILRSKADVLYNGGIGTYIKSSTETDAAVQDKTNDAVRINACDLQVKIIAEGGNLGVTQLGRIEFAQHGGNIYTDAIDNSAGVDCSDHEVNIKILFTAIMQNQSLSVEQRNIILASMESEVISLVLRNNYRQTLALRTAQQRAPYTLPNHHSFIQKLKITDKLDSKLECLPTEADINQRLRSHQGLSLPELAILLAYAKISIKRNILASHIVTDSDFKQLLMDYFPHYLQINYTEFIDNHHLSKEIIANELANLVVNRAGITFVSRFSDEFNCPVDKIVKAWWISFNLLNAQSWYAQIEALDGVVAADIQLKLLIGIEKAVERLCRWVLMSGQNNASLIIAKFKQYVFTIEQQIADIIDSCKYPEVQAEEATYLRHNVPVVLAKLMSRWRYLPQIMDIVMLATAHNLANEFVAQNYFELGRLLQLDWLRQQILLLPRENKWQAIARSALLGNLAKIQHNTMLIIIQQYQGNSTLWLEQHNTSTQTIIHSIQELQQYKTIELAMLSAVSHQISEILSML